MKISKFLTGAVLFASLSAQAAPSDWRITQPTWTSRHEQEFGEFVGRIGAAVAARQCGRVDTCMKSLNNIYYKSDPQGLKYFSDCADLPYYLRSYFAWKNGLPFSVASAVEPKAANGASNRDVRYSGQGNKITKRFDVIAENGRMPNAFEVLNRVIPNYTYSATYRMIGNENEGLMSDFYPAKLSREAIRPGTIIYDPNGHVAIVYKVKPDGSIFYIDAHPDNSLTSGLYTPKFVRSNPGQGAGFKNFRPLALVGASQDSSGAYVGGKIVLAKNEQIPQFGLEQFYGTNPDSKGDWKKGQFIFDNRPVNYYDYVRLSVAEGRLQIDPVEDMKQLVEDVCVSLQDRVPAVEGAISSGLINRSHPERLPYNIYGTDGDWESYSTPSRDARLKVSYMDVLVHAQKSLDGYQRGDSSIVYNGNNLTGDLAQAYLSVAQSCKVSYKNTAGRTITFNLEEARQRLFDMSFDPYHCVELRWGARTAEELATCKDDSNKREWYSKEKWLRFQWERRYDARMDYSLRDLTGPLPGAGIAEAPNTDVLGFLRSK